MKTSRILLFCAAVLLTATGCMTTDTGFSNRKIDLSSAKGINYIQDSCYEVVILKPDEEKSQIVYESELPWNLLDVTYRNDKYYSLGTAFAISENKLITATHVLDLYSDSLVYPQRFVREKRIDENGNKVEKVYEVDQILSINNKKDYVVFTLKDKTFDRWLDLQEEYEFNTKIYTAGNAFGEGLVIREGILLEETPEGKNGEWNYLKSSIMTNPGNSGGPMMNAAGKVLGVVLSKKDDFCYALPISEVDYSEGYFNQDLRYLFPLFNDNRLDEFSYNINEIDGISLPMDYRKFIEFHSEISLKNGIDGMDKLFEKYQGETFPNGENSKTALYSTNSSSFPQVLLKDPDDKQWFFSSLKPAQENLDGNGSIRYQQIYNKSDYWIIEIIGSDDQEPSELYNNPKEMMDYMLKGIRFSRKLFNNDSGTRVLSYGEPLKVWDYSDSYGRKWKFNIWLEDYSDHIIFLVSTPTPKGVACLYLVSSSEDLETYVYDIEKVLDFVDVNYYGKTEEWLAFLDHKELLPDNFSGLELDYTENSSLKLKTNEFEIDFTNEYFDIADNNELYIDFDIFRYNSEFVWDLRKIVFQEFKSDNYFLTYRYLKPDPSLRDSYQNTWKDLVAHKHPFSGSMYIDNEGNSKIGIVHPAFENVQDFDEVFSIFLSREGNIETEKMTRMLSDYKKAFIFK